MTRIVHPTQTLTARIDAVLIADEGGFETRPVDALQLDLEGIALPGPAVERHRGYARAADARTPWFPRGSPIRNSRQISIVSVEDLTALAAALEVTAIRPEWLGANLVVVGLPDVSLLPAGTRLFAPEAATLAVEGLNSPCLGTGRAVARHCPERPGLEFAFVRAAGRRRGLVAWVERTGTIRPGDAITIRIPEQWIY